jgi:hypothetical protein
MSHEGIVLASPVIQMRARLCSSNSLASGVLPQNGVYWLDVTLLVEPVENGTIRRSRNP